jgi:hypothetical protein
MLGEPVALFSIGLWRCRPSGRHSALCSAALCMRTSSAALAIAHERMAATGFEDVDRAAVLAYASKIPWDNYTG